MGSREMGMRAAALGATKLLEPVALATFSEIDETPDLLRRPGPPFPPLLATRQCNPALSGGILVTTDACNMLRGHPARLHAKLFGVLCSLQLTGPR